MQQIFTTGINGTKKRKGGPCGVLNCVLLEARCGSPNPSTSECQLIWRQSAYRGHQGEVMSAGGPQFSMSGVLIKGGSLDTARVHALLVSLV